MHPIDPSAESPVPRSKLGDTLLRLNRHLEVNRQREQASIDLFHEWQARWANNRDLIARHLECLDRELAQLTFSVVPPPHLSLLSLSARNEEDSEDTEGVDGSQEAGADDQDAIIRSANVRWQQT